MGNSLYHLMRIYIFCFISLCQDIYFTLYYLYIGMESTSAQCHSLALLLRSQHARCKAIAYVTRWASCPMSYIKCASVEHIFNLILLLYYTIYYSLRALSNRVRWWPPVDHLSAIKTESWDDGSLGSPRLIDTVEFRLFACDGIPMRAPACARDD